MFGNKSYKPLSADIGTNDGINSNLICFDELHRQKTRDLYDVLIGSMAAKEQPIFIMITTAGSDLNSICYEQHEYAIKVRDGIIKDDRFLPVIYAADKEDDPFLEATWKKANPNYGVSIKPDYMKEQAAKAKNNAAYLNTFLRLHLNIWTNVETVWITDDKYLKCTDKLDINKLEFEECYAGLDLSSVSDITAFTLVFPPSYRDYYGDKYLSFSWYWLPEEKGANSADKNNNNYAGWLRDGFIEETSGNVIDYDYIKPQIEGICSRFKVVNMAFDPYNSHQIAAKLSETFTMTQFRQGFVSMNFPTKQLEIKINRQEILFDNNPVTRWMMSNAVLLTNKEGNLVKIDKNQPHQKIDGVITNIMALGLCTTEVEKTGSYLDSEDLIVL
jgi:phage terminase large subunit-like protein